MNKKMFIICAVFALMISCKNYAISEDLKNLEQDVKGKVEGFLEAKKEALVGGLKKLGSEAYSKVEELIMQADGPQVQAEEQVAQGVFEDPELKEKGLEEKIEELKELKDSSKKAKEDRKKELEEAKQKLEEFKRQVESVTENTDKVKNQGKIGREAFLYAKKLGVNGSYSANDGTDTDKFAKKVIDDALENIKEELEKLAEPQNSEDKK
ncbi:outer surface protein ErpG [Borreliella bavariensis]|uniref:outer surface protein ErpG n=1 Tax=Borreliella bavariensis TaxID=664662 RepID=UPI001C0056F1|nr:outer surface protein ErpG [Borreliella bavariensis]